MITSLTQNFSLVDGGISFSYGLLFFGSWIVFGVSKVYKAVKKR